MKNTLLVLFLTHLCWLPMRCSPPDSQTPLAPVAPVSLQGKHFLQAWNASTRQAWQTVEKRHCLTKAATERHACACLIQRIRHLELQDDSAYNFGDSRSRLLLGYHHVRQEGAQRIYMVEIRKAGEILEHQRLIYALSAGQSRYYTFGSEEVAAGGWCLDKTGSMPPQAGLLLDSLWASMATPTQNRPGDYCSPTSFVLTQITDRIATKTLAANDERSYYLFAQVNQLL